MVLGIDAGGTKTVCVLADDRGQVVAESRGGGANLQASGELEVEKVLHDVMAGVMTDHDVMPSAICLGIAGVDRPDDAQMVRGIMRRIGFRTPIVIVNDALIALVAGAGEQPGIVLVAGTGSIAYGRNADGTAARAGGWGYLLGDEGGGFWIGCAALAAIVRASDGRAPATQLTDRVLHRMDLASPNELVQRVYERDLPRHAIAALVSVVVQAAAEGDRVAVAILASAADELTVAGLSVIRKLEMHDEAFPIILSGGVFRHVPALVADVTARLAVAAPHGATRVLDVEPAAGAVQLALDAVRGTLRIPRYA
jgi:N-acetylglucosamine kinase-like BadF-type ATPase